MWGAWPTASRRHQVHSLDGKPVANAFVDVWQSDSEGFYDVQYPDLPEGKLRGRFLTTSNGEVRFWSIMPTAYQIPHDGPVGEMLRATARHPWRPAHLHFMVSAQGYETLITHLFVACDPYLNSDAVFGVKDSLISTYPSDQRGVVPPDGRKMCEEWRRLQFTFKLNR